MAIRNLIKGLIPYGAPKTELCIGYTVAASQVVTQGSPVLFSSGLVQNIVDTTVAALIGGVALGSGEAGDEVTICIDPNQLYSILEADNTYAQNLADIGLFAKLDDTAEAAVNYQSQCVLDGSTAAAAPTDAVFHVQIVNVDRTVENESATAGVCRVIVKLNNPVFAGSDATS